MKIKPTGFSASVQLPCRIFIGPRRATEHPGVATNIESGRVRVSLSGEDLPEAGGSGREALALGDEVELDMALPVQVEWVQAKSLHVRAKVASLEARPDGILSVELTFRKPAFRDRAATGQANPRNRVPKAAAGWKM